MFPISVDPSPEAFDGRSNENVAKTVLVEGRNDYRSAVLGPRDVHRSRLIGAVDFNISTRRGEAPYLVGLVTNSCSSSARLEITLAETFTSLPVMEKRPDVSCSW